jgi:integrase
MILSWAGEQAKKEAGGEGARKTPIHSVHTARMTIELGPMNGVDAVDRGYDPLRGEPPMAKSIEQLTEKKIRSFVEPGLYPDGRGLYLQIRHGGAKSWIFRFTRKGRTRDKGLGSLVDVGLMLARSKAAQARALLVQDIDPIQQAKAERQTLPITRDRYLPPGRAFREAAESYMAEKLKRLRNAVHRAQWRFTLETYAYPVIGNMDVAAISTPDILRVLRPIWETKCETAMRLRGRIERILAREAVEGRRIGINPAVWKGHLQEAMPSPSEVSTVVHHPAMPIGDLPAFMADLGARTELSAAALKFLILTASRTGEVTGARWPEVDLNVKTWTIPASRYKTGREHVVPLSAGALAVLNEMAPLKEQNDSFIFSGRSGGELSQMTMLMLLQRRMGRSDCTVHGFRSTFKDWAEDVACVPREISERCLGHVVKSKVERAYRRGSATERRRDVMEKWYQFCSGFPSATVVPLRAVS